MTQCSFHIGSTFQEMSKGNGTALSSDQDVVPPLLLYRSTKRIEKLTKKPSIMVVWSCIGSESRTSLAIILLLAFGRGEPMR
jgi:hypothetical protein